MGKTVASGETDPALYEELMRTLGGQGCKNLTQQDMASKNMPRTKTARSQIIRSMKAVSTKAIL